MRAVLIFDQATVNRGRERRIVQRHREVRPFVLAGFAPRRAQVIAIAGLDAEVGRACAGPVVGDELDLDVQG